ncbi:Negative regulator of RAS-cAMP pathway [Nakaseomyces bracarensis]|uniref:Negative regulator of RAS-cAMP pathway n=1 Tax=Nakaseomyces bracarensis TaxID=273131 RepID=A0ABR4NPR8_9SACH
MPTPGLPNGSYIPTLELPPASNSNIKFSNDSNGIKSKLDSKAKSSTSINQINLGNNSDDKSNQSQKSGDFLKVSPNLFTPERLYLFDTLDLYLTLIKASNTVQQGDRLGNLSWRILNKALLRNKDINSSKKRDGVKNMFHILNPMNQPASGNAMSNLGGKKLGQDQVRTSENRVRQPVVRPMETLHSNSKNVAKNKSNENLHRTVSQPDNQQHLVKERQHKSTTALFQKHNQAERSTSHTNSGDGNNNPRMYFNKQYAQIQQVSKKENPQMIVTGFDTNMVIVRKTTTNESLHNKRSKSRSKSPADIATRKSTHKRTTSNASSNSSKHENKHSIFKHESLFGKPKQAQSDDSNGNGKRDNKIFFSSEDEDESDWDSVSDSSEFYTDDIEDDEEGENYNDEDDDQYYKKQWDKLLFSKGNHMDKKASSNSPENLDNLHPLDKLHSASQPQQLRRSLLSGLFHNESSNSSLKSSKEISDHSEKPNAPSHQSSASTTLSSPNYPINSSQHKPTIETTNITAIGSVTPPQNTFIEPSQFIRETLTRTSSNMQSNTSRRGSSSSIVSSNTSARYLHESNAPLTAQTLLPTALATHMFLPNSVQQQRKAVAAAVAQREGRRLTRRESMDIPIKNVKNSALKTRMEISEEERYQRSHNTRRHK